MRPVWLAVLTLCVCFFAFILFSLFFDEVLFVRKNTIFRVETSRPVVALTFDDGPSPKWTPEVLKVLSEEHCKATFFLLGKHVDQYPAVARMIVDQGSEIGSHTYGHTVLLLVGKKQILDQLRRADEAIMRATGIKPVFFRPPKGWVTDEQKELIESLGYRTILWALNSKDWVTFDDKYIVNYLVKRIHPGDIILFHDGGGAFGTEGGDRHETVAAVRQLIKKLHEQGYAVTSVGALLAEAGR